MGGREGGREAGRQAGRQVGRSLVFSKVTPCKRVKNETPRDFVQGFGLDFKHFFIAV